MLLVPVIEKVAAIQTLGNSEFRKVAGAANFAAAREDLKNPPAAYVLPARDSAGPNQLGGGGAILQTVRESFGVVLALSNLRDTTGHAAQRELERVRRLVITELLGFVPGDGYEPCEYGGGQLLLVTTEVQWWQLVFTTAYMERNF